MLPLVLVGALTLWETRRARGAAAHATGALPDVPGLQRSVVDQLPALFGKWEGAALPYMYTDSKGFVTTGTGNLIDPVDHALALTWRRPDGGVASPDEVRAAWQTVKDAWPGVQSIHSKTLTDLRLDQNALDGLMGQTIKSFVGYLVKRYPQFSNWPADAQMAILSISWAWGPGFSTRWGSLGKDFDAAVNAAPPKFSDAGAIMRKASAHEESINPGIVPRDIATQAMLVKADVGHTVLPILSKIAVAASAGLAVLWGAPKVFDR